MAELELNWSITKAVIQNITISDVTVNYNGHKHSITVSSTVSPFSDNFDGNVFHYAKGACRRRQQGDKCLYLPRRDWHYTVTAKITPPELLRLRCAQQRGRKFIRSEATILPIEISNISMSDKTIEYNAQTPYLYLNQAQSPFDARGGNADRRRLCGGNLFHTNRKWRAYWGNKNNERGGGGRVHDITATVGEDSHNYLTLVIQPPLDHQTKRKYATSKERRLLWRTSCCRLRITETLIPYP